MARREEGGFTGGHAASGTRNETNGHENSAIQPMNSSFEKSLMRLPLRGVVAVATRAARRLHPLYAIWAAENGMETEVASLVNLIDITDHFVCQEELVSVEDVGVEQAAYHANDVAFPTNDERPIRSSFATLGAHGCALLCFKFCKSGARNYLEHALESAESAVIANDFYDYGPFEKDVARLASLEFGEFPSLGKSFDPSETGPLGSIWNDVRPSWCEAGMQVMASCLKA